jgi:hypothetical protein
MYKLKSFMKIYKDLINIGNNIVFIGHCCLTTLSTIFQLYRGVCYIGERTNNVCH